jgi:hypothetical protein
VIKDTHRRGRRLGSVVAAATVALTAAAVVTGVAPAAAVGAESKGSHNVTGKNGKVPSVLRGDQYECDRTNPEMTTIDDSEYGSVLLRTDPGHLKFDIAAAPKAYYWQDAYISAGNNPDGYNSAGCDWIGVGKGYQIPVPANKAGTLTASIKLHTATGFEGDAGFDIWLTAPGTHTGHGTTSREEEASAGTTEIMVWLNSPNIDRGGYDSLGYRTVDGRRWDVLYETGSPRHKWTTVIFATSLATSKAATVSDRDIHLSTLIRFAASHGWVKTRAELQAIDAGFEWYHDPDNGTHIQSYSLTGVR